MGAVPQLVRVLLSSEGMVRFICANVCAFWLAGCAASYLNPLPEDVPEGAVLVRCTQYEGHVGGYFTGSNVTFNGCQCISLDNTQGELIIDVKECELLSDG